jgi:response regulator RpfG family c-di-GMP phosphodiesterase
MSLAEGPGGSSSPASVALGELLAFFGSVADYAAGATAEQGERIAALAVRMGKLADLTQEQCDALYFAARLRNAGALGNAAFAKGEPLPERSARMAKWDIPAAGARLCERIAALPASTAETIRWQAECWDGTGFPDQLRWSGIARPAQLLHIAAEYVAIPDPEEALIQISSYGGRLFSPEDARTFIMWYHTFQGTIEPVQAPHGALAAARTPPAEIVETLSEAIDTHNGTPGRAARIKTIAEDIARTLGHEEGEIRNAALGAQLFGIGELRAAQVESEQFDPLARLGIEIRAGHAVQSALLLSTCRYLAAAAPAVRARAEWFDGTGGPDRLRHTAIPPAAHVLSVAIAYDALDQAWRSRSAEDRTMPLQRLETAAGTQFDPKAVRALAEVLKTHA